jgi:hypothetical protein
MDLIGLSKIKDGRILAKHIHQDPTLDWMLISGTIVATKDQEIARILTLSEPKKLRDFLAQWAHLNPIPRATAKGWEVTASEDTQ